jgi:hypothetical protein
VSPSVKIEAPSGPMVESSSVPGTADCSGSWWYEGREEGQGRLVEDGGEMLEVFPKASSLAAARRCHRLRTWDWRLGLPEGGRDMSLAAAPRVVVMKLGSGVG